MVKKEKNKIYLFWHKKRKTIHHAAAHATAFSIEYMKLLF